MNRVVIVDSVRSGITKSFRGKLRNTRPDDLAAMCVNSLLDRNPGLTPAIVDDCIVGCAFPEGPQGMNLGRNIAVLSKLSSDVAGTTVNRYCGSGLQAVAFAANQINAGGAGSIIAGGVESVSLTLKFVNTMHVYNQTIQAQVPGMYIGMNTIDSDVEFIKNVFGSMGQTAEIIAEKYNISRETQDAYAALSQRRTFTAQQAGIFNEEIIPINVKIFHRMSDGSMNTFKEELLDRDECNRSDTSLESLANLKPSFKEGGTVTAGNSSQITDGACMCLLASDEQASRYELPRLGYFLGYATAGCAPEEMGVGPILAVRKLLDKFKMSISDVDLFEMNEAFASSTIYCQEQLGIDLNKVNVNGGAISIGHPFGMTGARQVGHIVRELARRDKHFGVVTMCIGGGMGLAALVERA